MVFVKGVGLNFYRHVARRVRRPHVKNQPNSPIGFNNARPLKNPIFDFSGTNPGFPFKTNLRRYTPTYPSETAKNQLDIRYRPYTTQTAR